MTDALSVKILAALDKQMYGKKGIDNLEEVYKDQQMEKGSDSSDWYRRRGKVRKDGRSRTHKRKVPLSVGKGPSQRVLEERALRDAKRVYYAWYLWNY